MLFTESGAAAVETVLEKTLKRDRLVVLAGLVATTALSWVYLVKMARDMQAMADSTGMSLNAPCTMPWSTDDAIMMFHHVGHHDGRYDDSHRGAHGAGVCGLCPAAARTEPALRSGRSVLVWLLDRVDRV